MATQRVTRGRASQVIVAEWWQKHGFPDAESRAASLPGRDILYLLGLACEVKATGKFDMMGSLRQAVANAKGDLPFVIYRPKGYGPGRIAEWPVIIRLSDFTELLNDAGYGEAA